MKKQAFILMAAMLLVGHIGMTQNLSFGPMAGVNFTTLSNKDNTSTKTGLAAGGFFNYSSKKWFGIGVQVLYNQLGTKLTDTKDEINLNYLQVPLLATYYFNGGSTVGSFRPKLFAGPHVNFLLNAKNKDGNELNPNGAVYKDADFGITLGGGFNYAIADRTWLNFDVRYGVGLTDATKSVNSDIMNRGVGINLGVSFPLGNI